MIQTPNLDLFAGIPVADYAAALAWYERLLGFPPSFFPTDTEAVIVVFRNSPGIIS
jgi:hypothetical protein